MNDLSGVYLVISIFLLVLAVLWFFLPFAIFGIKDKLSEIIAEGKETNNQLSKLQRELLALKSDSQ